jgi:hypothetical protein
MLLILGLSCQYSAYKWNTTGISALKLAKSGAILFTVICSVFILVGYLREGEGSSFNRLIGYTVGSYNRLSAALDGKLNSNYNFPYYSIRFLWHPPMLRRFINISSIGDLFGWNVPSSVMESYFDEFSNIESSGLNENYIWPTAYGYAFFDFRWFSPLIFAVYGFVASAVWVDFCGRKAYSFVLYPYIVSSILMWSTDNFMSIPLFSIFLITSGCIRFFWKGDQTHFPPFLKVRQCD